MFLLYLIPTWFYYNFIEYFLHSLSHNNKTYIYNIHKKHHTIHYPIKNLIQKSPYKTDFHKYIFSDGFLAHGIPFIGILIINTFLFKEYSNKINTWLLINAYISDYIHTQIHTKDSWLEKYSWFLKKRDLHLLHHKKNKKNINIMTSIYDKLFNTYIEN